MTTTTAPTVLVRFEIAALGHGWHDEVTVTVTPLVEALVARGALTVLDDVDVDVEDQADDEQPVEPAAPATDAVSWFAPETTPAG